MNNLSRMRHAVALRSGMDRIFSMFGMAIEKPTAKVEAPPKTSAVEVLLVELMGERCQLEFERQDEAFEGVLNSSFDDLTWVCGATFKAHWVNAIEINRDATYTICVRIPDSEHEDLLSMDCDEMLTYDEENEGRSPDCENWR